MVTYRGGIYTRPTTVTHPSSKLLTELNVEYNFVYATSDAPLRQTANKVGKGEEEKETGQEGEREGKKDKRRGEKEKREKKAEGRKGEEKKGRGRMEIASHSHI